MIPSRNANASIQCPVEEGKHVVSHKVALPKEIPQGLPLEYPGRSLLTLDSSQVRHQCQGIHN